MESLIPFVLILAAFYFVIIRPQRNRARQTAAMQTSVAPGVEVMTTAGLYGTVTEVTDDAVHLEVAPGVILRFAKAAIGRVLTETDGADDADDGVGADDADDGVGAEGSDAVAEHDSAGTAGQEDLDLRDDSRRRSGE